jgi:hypothetical protein
MTTMRVVPMAENEFGVEVEEGHETTGHRIRLPEAFLDDLLLAGVDRELVVRETINFLLEREPATSILPEFSLEDVSRYFPEFPEELQRRLS